MKRLLFVDDEPRILDGLRDMLRKQRRRWDMTFALGGEEAVARLSAEAFDVVVTDMRMPRVDGTEVLSRAQESCPGAVRIVLSGYAELEATLRAAAIAHQFLSKPCDPAVLENVVERACALQALVCDATLRAELSRVERLPSRPSVYSALVQLMQNPRAGSREIATLVQRDVAICAKLLQLVNSGFFGTRQQITSIEQAVTCLGTRMVQNLVLASEVFANQRSAGVDLRALQRHSLLVARIASQCLDNRQASEDAFLAGLLHDVGVVVLDLIAPTRSSGDIEVPGRQTPPWRRVEEGEAGVTHSTAGAYLLGLWGLPYPIVEAVAHHHDPTPVPQQGLDVLAAVHIADGLAAELGSTAQPGLATSADVDEYAARLGVSQRLTDWRERARRAAQTAEAA